MATPINKPVTKRIERARWNLFKRVEKLAKADPALQGVRDQLCQLWVKAYDEVRRAGAHIPIEVGSTPTAAIGLPAPKAAVASPQASSAAAQGAGINPNGTPEVYAQVHVFPRGRWA